MKIPFEQKAQIVDGMLAMLDHEATEEQEVMVKISGRDLINLHNVTRDKDGNLILPGKTYLYPEMQRVPVYHRQRIGHIIADAKNTEEMTAKLGEYLAKFAKDPAAVVQSIPAHLSLKNRKHNEN